jgi:hypothetical protein
VESLDLGSNELGGSLPAQLGANPVLRSLRLDNNSLSGELPAGMIG